MDLTLIHRKLRTNRELLKNISRETNFLKHESLEIGLVNCVYLLHAYSI